MLPPHKHTFDTIWGHEGPRQFVPKLLSQGRLPHAVLLTGPDAIGKRSLAFAMAKAILSAGKPPAPATASAPAPAFAKRKVDEPPPEDDAFGDDLFGGGAEEPDLFGAPEPPKPAPKAPEAPKAAPKEKPTDSSFILHPSSSPLLPESPDTAPQPLFLGYNERVCRLVEAAYPAEYDKDGRPSKVGHLDLTIIEPMGGRRGIVVDQIRALHDITSVAPIEGAFRVVLIFGADTITQEGGNSILKLLEEPPSYLKMILVANRLNRVLPTIKSRCQVVPMSPLSRGLLVEKLMDVEKLDRDLATVAAALSECRPGVALTAVEAALLQRRREVFQARLQVDRFGVPAIPAAAARIGQASKLEEALWLMLSFTRDRLVRHYAPEQEKLLIHGDALDLLDSVKADPLDLDEEADRLLDSYGALQHPFVPNSRAVLETALWPE